MEPTRRENKRHRRNHYSSRNQKLPKQIAICTKNNERAVSSQATTSKCPSGDVEAPQVYQLLAKSSSSSVAAPVMVAPPQMEESIELMNDESLLMNANLLEFLGDSNEFLVVGCIGLQGVGKSTILSHLANPTSVANPEEMVFKCQSKTDVDSGTHCTAGIQCYVSGRRVIFLDSQPLLSLSVLSKYYASDGYGLAVKTGHPNDPEYPNMENDVEIMFLQHTAFLLAVCHIVLVVQDHFYDSDLIRYIQTAEIMKPSSLHPDNESNDESSNHFPHCVLVHNKCSQLSFTHVNVRSMQESYKAMFSQSQIRIQSGLGMANGIFMPSLSPELCSDDPINLFLLPVRRQTNKPAHRVKEYEDVLDLLRSFLHGVPRTPLTYTTLSEKNWLHYAIKVWKDIRKSPMFTEYGRMLPTLNDFRTDHVLVQHPC